MCRAILTLQHLWTALIYQVATFSQWLGNGKARVRCEIIFTRILPSNSSQKNTSHTIHCPTKWLPSLDGKYWRFFLTLFASDFFQGLLFFRIQGYPYFHLHAGNVLVSNGMCQLSDYENGLLSLEPYHRRIITALAPKVDPDVVCFACVLWEMVTGYELDSVDTANFQLASLSWNPKIRNVYLNSI